MHTSRVHHRAVTGVLADARFYGGRFRARGRSSARTDAVEKYTTTDARHDEEKPPFVLGISRRDHYWSSVAHQWQSALAVGTLYSHLTHQLSEHQAQPELGALSRAMAPS